DHADPEVPPPGAGARHAVAVLVGGGGAVVAPREELTHAGAPRRPLGVAGVLAAVARADAVRARRAVVARPHHVRRADAAGARLVAPPVAVVVHRRDAVLGHGDDLVHAGTVRRSQRVAGLRPAVADADPLRARGPVVAARGAAGQAHTACAVI